MNSELFDPKDVPSALRDCFEEVETRCLAPWARVVERMPEERSPLTPKRAAMVAQGMGWKSHGAGWRERQQADSTTLGWQPACACDAGDPVKATVLDCFAGSGTTLLVADRLGRDAIGIELSEVYAEMARARLAGDAPLWNGLSESEPEVVQDKQGALGKRTYSGFNARWKAKQDGLGDGEADGHAPLALFEEMAI